MKMEHLHPTRALPFDSRFLVAILENEKNLSGNCQGTNLESLECQSTTGLFTVLFGKKKNNS